MSSTVNTRLLDSSATDVPINQFKSNTNPGDVDFTTPVSGYADQAGEVVESLIEAAGRDTGRWQHHPQECTAGSCKDPHPPLHALQ